MSPEINMFPFEVYMQKDQKYLFSLPPQMYSETNNTIINVVSYYISGLNLIKNIAC